MCVPACTQKIAKDIAQNMGRRKLLKGAVGAAALAAAGCAVPPPPVAGSAESAMAANGSINFSRVVDLTHTMGVDFPTYSGEQNLELEALAQFDSDGFNMYRWLLVEHTGTHMDAPFHFSDQETADQIAVENLVGQLAVVDIRAKAEADPDAQLTPDDLSAWEAEHGPIADGSIVAMNSGWDQHVTTGTFRNADNDGVMHFPGFHIEAIEFLLTERNAKGIFVDTLSLDYGPSPDFAVHYRWLPANKWGIECVANLGDLPSTGATVIVGGPKIAGATGGMTRVIALV